MVTKQVLETPCIWAYNIIREMIVIPLTLSCYAKRIERTYTGRYLMSFYHGRNKKVEKQKNS